MSQQAAVPRRKIAGERSSRRGHAVEANEIGAVSRARVLPSWLLIGLAVLTAVVLAFDGVSWARSASTDSETIGADALNAAPAQAEHAAEQILSYDYSDLRADTTAAAASMTPAYAQTFERTVDDLLADPATEQRGVVSAKVMASGVVSADEGRVDVLLFVDQTSTTKASKTPQTALNRVVFTMVQEGDRWLVDDVTAL